MCRASSGSVRLVSSGHQPHSRFEACHHRTTGLHSGLHGKRKTYDKQVCHRNADGFGRMPSSQPTEGVKISIDFALQFPI